MRFSRIIRGATLIDGAGGPPRTADLAIAGDSIAELGDLTGAHADETIDAAGLVACPGFIDIHTHSDTTLLRYPEAESRVRQGITTEVVGNCSYSAFPVTNEVGQVMGRCLSQGMTDPDWQWTDQQGYYDALRTRGTAVNVVPLVGHGSLRIAAMGCDNRPPTASELKSMQRLAAEAIDHGAFGISTGLTLAPSSYADTAEIIEVSKPVGERGGFYATHSRLWAGHHFKAVEEAIAVGRGANLPVQISHQTIIDPRHFGQAGTIVGLMEAARAEGIDVTYDVYPYTAGSSQLDQYLPDWALDGGVDAMLARLADPAARKQIRDETNRGWFRGIPWQWERVMLAHAVQGDAVQMAGKSIAEIAELWGLEPIDAFLQLIESQRNDVSVVQFNRDEPDVQFFLSHPLAMIGSDGASISPRDMSLAAKPHPRCYGCFPRVLGRYCRELGIMPLETAIHKMTGAPAARLGLTDRGTLARGAKADIVLFDPATIADGATFDNPHRFPTGIHYVFVNGQTVVRPQGNTGNLPGKVLTKG